MTIIVFLAYTGSGWRQVWPCVKPEEVPQMQAAREARVKRAKRVQSLASSMPPPLRANVSRLVVELTTSK